MNLKMILDRTIAPQAQQIEKVNILKAEHQSLDNGLSLYTIRAGEQPVMRLELIFEAGTKRENHHGASFFTSKMMLEGTSKHSAGEISGVFDQYGTFIEINQSADRMTLMVYGLTEHLGKILPMICKMISDSVIPEKELEIQRKIALQNLKVNQEKTAFVASQIFREKVFGLENAYGRSQTETSISAILQSQIKDFYTKNIQNQPFKVFLSGKFDENEVALVNKFLGNIQIQNSEKSIIQSNNYPISNQNYLIEKTESVQSTIRLGRIMFNRKNPDLIRFIVTNTLFGGYFGSRLGFTYGISSSLIPLAETGYLIIGTDVKKEFTIQAIDEIHKEIRKLQTERVSENELDTVKNYAIGAFVGSLNTPFEVADRQKNVILDELVDDFYEKYIERIRAVSSNDVLEMTNQYLQIDDICQVVVGGMP
jgi:zinc protease